MSSTLFFASNVPLREVVSCFVVVQVDRIFELPTEKKQIACLEWYNAPEQAAEVLRYLQEQTAFAGELEFWHVWQDMDFGHRVRMVEIPICELTTEDIRELVQLEVWREPVTDYCFRLTSAGKGGRVPA